MAKMVEIHSNVTINVTAGLQNKNVTNPDAHIPDRLKVSAEWPRHTVLIRQGQHRYPSYLKEWPSVKALAADKVLTIGMELEVNDTELTEEELKRNNTVEEAKKDFDMPDIQDTKRKARHSLEDLVNNGE